MKKIIVVLCTLFFTNNLLAQSWLNISQPEYIDIHNGSERIEKVKIDKHGTIVYLTCTGQAGTEVFVPVTTYITDEQGNHYKVKETSGIVLNEKKKIGKSGKLTYNLSFPALPKGTSCFDMVQKYRNSETHYLNIHQYGITSNISTTVDTTGIYDALDKAFPDKKFGQDTVWISGQFKGTTLFEKEKCMLNVVVPIPSVCGNKRVYSIDVNSDGTFCGAIPVAGPMWTELLVVGKEKHFVSKTIPAMFFPSEHLSLIIDDYDTEPKYTWQGGTNTYNSLLAQTGIFTTRNNNDVNSMTVNVDSLKRTVSVSETAACYIANKYHLSKIETGLLLTQANMSKMCEALRCVNSYVLENSYQYWKSLRTSYPSHSQFDTIQALNNGPAFSVLSLLKADSKAFLIVPSLEELTREMQASPLFRIDISSVVRKTMQKDDYQLYLGEQYVHQLRKHRGKPLGTDKLLEQWLTFVKIYGEGDKIKSYSGIKNILEQKLNAVTLPVYMQWKNYIIKECK